MQPPGWYADPLGPAGDYRWWDGSAWTDQTTRDPTSASDATTEVPVTRPAPGAPAAAPTRPVPPPSPAPGAGGYPPGSPPPMGYGPLPSPPSRLRAGSSRTPIVVGAVAIVVVLVVGVAVLVATRGDGDDVLAGNGTTTTAEDETTTTNDDDTTTTEDEGGGDDVLTAGDLAFTALGSPWEVFPPGTGPPFIDSAGQFQLIAELPDGGAWVSQVLVGILDPTVISDDLRDDLGAAATQLADFLTTEYMVAGASVTSEDSGSFDVDGTSGFRIRRDFTFSASDIPSTGSTWIMVVVDTGNPLGLSAFWGAAPVEETDHVADVEAALESLTVT